MNNESKNSMRGRRAGVLGGRQMDDLRASSRVLKYLPVPKE